MTIDQPVPGPPQAPPPMRTAGDLQEVTERMRRKQEADVLDAGDAFAHPIYEDDAKITTDYNRPRFGGPLRRNQVSRCLACRALVYRADEEGHTRWHNR